VKIGNNIKWDDNWQQKYFDSFHIVFFTDVQVRWREKENRKEERERE